MAESKLKEKKIQTNSSVLEFSVSYANLLCGLWENGFSLPYRKGEESVNEHPQNPFTNRKSLKQIATGQEFEGNNGGFKSQLDFSNFTCRALISLSFFFFWGGVY